MKMKLNVEELRKEILEGARAVPLAQSAGKGVGEGTEKGNYAEEVSEVAAGGKGEDVGESSYTNVGNVAAVGVVYEVEVGLEVSLEEGMLGWWG